MSGFGENAAEHAFTDVVGDDGFESPVRVHHDRDAQQEVGGLGWTDEREWNNAQHADGKHSLGLPQGDVIAGR